MSLHTIRHEQRAHDRATVFGANIQKIQEKLQTFFFDHLIWFAINRWKVCSVVITGICTRLHFQGNTFGGTIYRGKTVTKERKENCIIEIRQL